MKIKTLVLLGLGTTLSAPVFATVVPYQLSAPGHVVSCKAVPAGPCKTLSPSSKGTFSYDNTTQTLSMLMGPLPGFSVKFANNAATKMACSTFSLVGQNTMQPASYCKNSMNDYLSDQFTFALNPANGHITITNSVMTMNLAIAGVWIKVTTAGTKLVPTPSAM